MLSKKLHDALNEQINAELWSAYLYLSMSMDAEAKGLKGVANWFFVQFQEEQDHARILMNYINRATPSRAEADRRSAHRVDFAAGHVQGYAGA